MMQAIECESKPDFIHQPDTGDLPTKWLIRSLVGFGISGLGANKEKPAELGRPGGAARK